MLNIISHQIMKIKVTVWYYFTPTKMANIKGTDKYPKGYRATRALKYYNSQVDESVNGRTTLENSFSGFYKVKCTLIRTQ